MTLIYQNYHRHSYYSNVIVPDCVVTNEDYAKRAVELGHSLISGVDHGWCGHYIDGYELSKKYNLKFVFGSEMYFVKNRLEKDRTNAHIILLAKNENGRQSINDIISEANLSGFYYHARLDLPLLLSLPKNDVWITTACVGGVWKYEDSEDIVLQLFDHFKDNFFLEVQNHNTDSQKKLNQRIINLSNQHNIKTIFGVDSHMIYPNQAHDREDFLLSKKISYEDEEHWFLDYPSNETAIERFVEQGILTKHQIIDAMQNTNILLDVEEYHSPIFEKEIKMPSLYPNNTQEEKDKIFVDLVRSEWEKEKHNVPENNWNHYKQEIQKEIDIVVTTKHADYFLLNREIILRGKSLGGVISYSGRGSAVSFYINKLLGFTQVDRISAKVSMYPERFMSPTRILESKTLADFDMNLANPEIFAVAQKQILGEESSYPLIAFGTMRPKAAFKMYARAKQIGFDTANLISLKIDSYEQDYKHASEEERETLNVLDYIEPEFRETFLGSQKYLGIVADIKVAPCGYLLYSGNIRREIGLIRINSVNGNQHICTVMDGLWAENYKFLKNDLLKVSVVELIDAIYKRLNIAQDTVSELLKKTEGDNRVWEIYKNAWTKGINQIEQHGTSGRAVKYKPKNIVELCAFIAAVRPGFASMYKTFESREEFCYDIPSFDKLIQTPEMPQSFVLYQEQSMATLNYAGIPMAECYEIIKNIAKKRAEKVLKYKETFLKGFSSKIKRDENKTIDEAKKLSEQVWKILEDSSFYSFNASHSYCVAIDSLYGAYLKAYYPIYFYEVFLNILEKSGEKDRMSATKVEAEKAFKIKFPPYRFGQDNREIVANPEKNEISSSLSSIKGFNRGIGEGMYELSRYPHNNFIDFLVDAEEKDFFTSKIEDLIKINYFDCFGGNLKLHKIYLEFTKGKFRYHKELSQKSKDQRLPELKKLLVELSEEKFPFFEQIVAEEEILGYMQAIYPSLPKNFVYVLKLDETFAPRIEAYCLATGKIESLKIQKKLFENKNFLAGDVINCKTFKKKPSVKFVNGKFEEIDNEFTWWIENYEIFPPDKFDKLID